MELERDIKMESEEIVIKGKVVDEETRCQHYYSKRDIIAIKFKCCGTYYPCIFCHEETKDHAVKKWPKHEFDEKAVLCGKCKSELTIQEYISSNSICPYCQSLFNDGCMLHHHLYFEQIDAK
ncbi:CHY zinc finger protein [Guptibacillus hwajinpoensis]|uniref:CHY zinc finger protein n=2 Tax=Guptibacillus hwajinpoensis TaxID=208199 RepID=UPI003D081991